MSVQKFAQSMYTGQDYVFYVREEVDGTLLDFSGWTWSLMGRKYPDSPSTLFSFTEADTDVIETGTFAIEQSDGSTLNHNIKITIQSATTLALRSSVLDSSSPKIHIGLMGTDASGEPYQIIVDGEIPVCISVAA